MTEITFFHLKVITAIYFRKIYIGNLMKCGYSKNKLFLNFELKIVDGVDYKNKSTTLFQKRSKCLNIFM